MGRKGKDAEPLEVDLRQIVARAATQYGFNRQQSRPIFAAVLEATLLEQERAFRAARQYLFGRVPVDLLLGLEQAMDAPVPDQVHPE